MTTLTITTEQLVSDIVRADHRTADVFKRFGINYCCGGKVPLGQACSTQQLNAAEVLAALNQAIKNIYLPNFLQFAEWKIDFLMDYISNIHHAYLQHSLPLLEVGLISFTNSHSKQHPHLLQVEQLFQQLMQLLLSQMKEEEEVVFPYIRQIESAHRRKETYGNLFVRTLRKPLNNIEADNKKLGQLLHQMRALTSHYQYPENACTNHRVIFARLKELDEDIVQHKHLESNILFPRALAIEQELLLQ